MSEETKNPPIGLMPLWLHREQRYTEIRNAMDRYIDAGMPIPKEWRNELQTLEGWIQGRNEELANKRREDAFNAARIRLADGELKYQDFYDYNV